MEHLVPEENVEEARQYGRSLYGELCTHLRAQTCKEAVRLWGRNIASRDTNRALIPEHINDNILAYGEGKRHAEAELRVVERGGGGRTEMEEKRRQFEMSLVLFDEAMLEARLQYAARWPKYFVAPFVDLG